MTHYEPPARTRQHRAADLAGMGTPYLFKGLDEDDSAWKLVEQKADHIYAPRLPEEVTVTCADDTVRVFNPGDQVLIGSPPK